jgi:hypothetical protein
MKTAGRITTLLGLLLSLYLLGYWLLIKKVGISTSGRRLRSDRFI